MKAFLRFTAFSFVFAAFLSVTGYGQPPRGTVGKNALPSSEAVAASGVFEGKLYTNGLLGFSVLVPGGWNIFTAEQNNAALAAGQANTLSNSWRMDEKVRVELNRSMANTQILFQATSRIAKGEPLSRISCGVERLTESAPIEQYVERNKRLVLLTSPTKLAKDVYSTTLGGTAFTGFDVQGAVEGKVFKQRYLVSIRKGYALFIVTTLWDNINDAVLDASLKTLKFGK